MSSKERVGARAEARFFRVVQERTEETPDWFLKVKETNAGWDMRGVDAFAFFIPHDNTKRVKVPIQIKSSAEAKRAYLQRCARIIRENVIFIVVSRRKSDNQLRSQVYSELGRVRNLRLRYDEFFSTRAKLDLHPAKRKLLKRQIKNQKKLRA